MHPDAVALRDEFAHQRGCFKIFLVIYMLIGACGGIGGGLLLAHELHHWIAWAISAILLEPIGILCLFSLITLFAPDSIAADFIGWAIARGRVAALIAGICYLGGILVLFLFALIGWVRS